MKELNTVKLDSKIAILSIDEIKALEKENVFIKHNGINRQHISTNIDHLYGDFEEVDVHYLDENSNDTLNIIISVDTQKLKNSPLKYLETIMEQLNLLTLLGNYNYTSVIRKQRHQVGGNAKVLLNMLLTSEHKEWYRDFLKALCHTQGGTAYSIARRMSEKYFIQYPENYKAWHRRSLRILETLLDLQILNVEKINSSNGRQANFFTLKNIDIDVLERLQVTTTSKTKSKPRKKTPKNPAKPQYTCKICKHEWKSRSNNTPKQCPSCQSRRWDKGAKPVVFTEMTDNEIIAKAIKRCYGIYLNRARRLASRILQKKKYKSMENIELIELLEQQHFNFDNWK